MLQREKTCTKERGICKFASASCNKNRLVATMLQAAGNSNY